MHANSRSHRICLQVALVVVACGVNATPLQAADPIRLHAGPVSMRFDAENVFLRYIRVGDHEVLRGINAPVRNENWATIPPKVSNLQVEQRDDGFNVTFDVACRRGDVDFRWQGAIVGTEQGEIEFTFDGEAHSTFKKNRIGFCVLHGPAAAGQPWVLETVDGGTLRGRFPKFVAPHQPAKNLRAIAHEVAPGLRARVAFEGDVFEMEDQRNWTDASFKTYCTPLAIPYPVELVPGDKISQKVRIRIEGEGFGAAAGNASDAADRSGRSPLPPPAADTAARTVLTLGDSLAALPRLGLQVSSEFDDLTDNGINRLKKLNLSHLQVDLALSDPSWIKNLRRATRQAKALGVNLQVVLGVGNSPDFAALVREIETLQPPVSFWLVRGGDPADFATARKHLEPIAGDAKIGVTRVTNFVDLNRARPEDPGIEAVGFAINPQIHAFDDASMVETLPIHADVVNSARQFAGDRPLVIGPITLAPQLLDGVDQPGGPPTGGPLPTYVDPRQVEPFAAAWMLGSLKYLADAHADSATYFETVGWAGVMDKEVVTSRPKAFPSRPGETFPVYRVLRVIGQFHAETVRQVDTSDNLAAVGLALDKPGRQRLLVANLTDKPHTVMLRGLTGQPVDVQVVGGEQRQATPELSIRLPPYGIGQIDRAVD